MLDKKWPIIFKWVLFAGLLVLCGWYVFGHRKEFAALVEIRPVFFPLLLVLPLLMLGILGYLNRILLECFDIDLVPKEWFGLAATTSLGNSLLPMSGGASSKAVYLKVKHRLPFAHFAAILGASQLLNLLLAAAVGTGCLLWLGSGSGSREQQALLGILLGIALFLLGVLTFRIPPIRPRNVLAQTLARALNGWERIRGQPLLLVRVSVLSLLSFLVLGAQLQVSFAALSIPSRFVPALAIATLLGFARILSLTPANLGIQELATAVLAQVVGVGFDEGLAASLLVRLTTTIVVFSLGPVFGYILMRDLNQGGLGNG